MFPAGFIHVLKQFLAGKVLTRPDDAGDAPVFDFHDVVLAAFAAELKFNLCAAHGGVAVFHRGQAVRFVVAGVFFVADADEADFEQAHDGSEDFFPAEAFAGEVTPELPPDAGQRAGKIRDPLKLGLVADFAPARVIEVLLATAFIPPGGLQMPVVQRTNPDVDPRRRDGERLDALEGVPVVQEPPCDGAIAEALTAAFAADAGPLVGDVAQTYDLGGPGRGRRGYGVRIDVLTGNSKWRKSPMSEG